MLAWWFLAGCSKTAGDGSFKQRRGPHYELMIEKDRPQVTGIYRKRGWSFPAPNQRSSMMRGGGRHPLSNLWFPQFVKATLGICECAISYCSVLYVLMLGTFSWALPCILTRCHVFGSSAKFYWR